MTLKKRSKNKASTIHPKPKEIQLMNIEGLLQTIHEPAEYLKHSFFTFSFAYVLKECLQIGFNTRRHPCNIKRFYVLYISFRRSLLLIQKPEHLLIYIHWSPVWTQRFFNCPFLSHFGSSMHLAKEFHIYPSSNSVPYLA